MADNEILIRQCISRCAVHAHSADHKQSVVAKAMTLSFSVSNVFNEKRKSHAVIICALNFKYPNLPMSEVQLTKNYL